MSQVASDRFVAEVFFVISIQKKGTKYKVFTVNKLILKARAALNVLK